MSNADLALVDIAARLSRDTFESAMDSHGLFAGERVGMYADTDGITINFSAINWVDGVPVSGAFLGSYTLSIQVPTAENAAALLQTIVELLPSGDGDQSRTALAALGFLRRY